MSNRAYKKGTHLAACDRCGETAHSDELTLQWNNLYVHRNGCYESRQPQDLVRGHKDLIVSGVTRALTTSANNQFVDPTLPPNWKGAK